MAFVQFSRVSLAFGDRDILKDITLNLAEGSRAALAGANGSGKTTFMKVLSGSVVPDSGGRAVQKGTRISYLPQSGIVHAGRTLREEAETAFSYGAALTAELERLGDELAHTDVPAKTEQLLEAWHTAQTALEESGWQRRHVLAEQVLAGLGFASSDLDRGVDEFSGGWQMRVALAKVLLENPDILLLDEPTNYLDLEARNWLEQWLRDFKGGFLLVSHDRYFLDVTVNDVYELFGGTLCRYPGNYTHYEDVRRAELDSLIARYEIQQEEIQKTEDFIRRFRYKPTKAAQVQERVKQLDKMEKIEIPESLKQIHFRFPPAPHSGRLVLTLDNFGRSYGERKIIDSLNLTVENGDRLVVAGRNGAGKSTLLRALSGTDTDYTGGIKLGAGVSPGYFSQDNAEAMTGSESIIDMMESEAPFELIPKLRDLLGAFLFRGDDIHKAVNVLSGGEKSRLALLRLLMRPVNLLILDEPTNHLDLHSKDVLLRSLRDFGGTVIFVSHDRDFIESLATRVLELTPGRARQFPGNYRYYLERLEAEERGEIPVSSAPGENRSSDAFSSAFAVKNPAGKEDVSAPSAWQVNREEEKKKKTDRRRLERKEESLLADIASAEEKKTALDGQLCDPAVYSDGEACRRVRSGITEADTLIASLTAEWEQTAGLLAEMD